MQQRLFYLDNLRTFLIFLVVIVHTGLVYEPVLAYSWIVFDEDQASAIGLIRLYLDSFIMFSLFFIAGYFVFPSLKSKTTWGFVKSKFNRLIFPWIVAVVTMIPIYKIIFLYSRDLPQEAWYTYFHIFNRPGANMAFFADNPVMNWLWFLPILFTFQMIFLLLTRSGWIPSKLSIRNGIITILVLSVSYSLAVSIMNLTGWHHSAVLHFQRERLLGYFLVFMLGALCYKQNAFDTGLDNKKLYLWANLALAVSIGIFTVMALTLFFNQMDPSKQKIYLSPLIDKGMFYLSLMTTMFSILYVLLYVFKRYLNRSGNLLRILSRNSYYVYIIHIPILGLIALLLLRVELPGFVKFIILTILTYTLSNGLVYLFRIHLEKSVSNIFVKTSLLLVALFITFSVYTRKDELDPANSSATLWLPNLPLSLGLHEAALRGNIDLIWEHIEAGSDLHVLDPSTGNSPLHTAAAFGQTQAAIALIGAGVDVNRTNDEGATPLMNAAFFCHLDIVQALLDGGADKLIQNKAGDTAFSMVAGPLKEVREIYEYCDKTYGPLGMKIDIDYLEKTRPLVAEILK